MCVSLENTAVAPLFGLAAAEATNIAQSMYVSHSIGSFSIYFFSGFIQGCSAGLQHFTLGSVLRIDAGNAKTRHCLKMLTFGIWRNKNIKKEKISALRNK